MIKGKMLIDKNKCYDRDMGDEAFIVYCILRSSVYQRDNIYHRSIAYFGYELYERVITKTEESLICKGLKELIDKEIVSIICKLTDTEYILDVTNINYTSKFFVNLTTSDVRKVMNIDTKVNKFTLLRYYITLLSTFKIDKSATSGKIGHMSQSYIKDLAGISIPTMNKYNEILEKNKIIFVSKSSDHEEYYDNSGNHRLIKFRNVYSRYEDRDLADSYVCNYSTLNFSANVESKTNKSRKYVQMYNAMLKGKEYDKDTAAEIYKGIIAWNEDKKKKYEDQISQGYFPSEPQYKDLSVFDKYKLD